MLEMISSGSIDVLANLGDIIAVVLFSTGGRGGGGRSYCNLCGNNSCFLWIATDADTQFAAYNCWLWYLFGVELIFLGMDWARFIGVFTGVDRISCSLLVAASFLIGVPG